MVIDSSAFLAILGDEPERHTFNEAIEAAETRMMSAATFVEASMVIESRYGAEGCRGLPDVFLVARQ
jgi:ribonuclease VapC